MCVQSICEIFSMENNRCSILINNFPVNFFRKNKKNWVEFITTCIYTKTELIFSVELNERCTKRTRKRSTFYFSK